MVLVSSRISFPFSFSTFNGSSVYPSVGELRFVIKFSVEETSTKKKKLYKMQIILSTDAKQCSDCGEASYTTEHLVIILTFLLFIH